MVRYRKHYSKSFNLLNNFSLNYLRIHSSDNSDHDNHWNLKKLHTIYQKYIYSIQDPSHGVNRIFPASKIPGGCGG